jgi:hypothetical protein
MSGNETAAIEAQGLKKAFGEVGSARSSAWLSATPRPSSQSG